MVQGWQYCLDFVFFSMTPSCHFNTYIYCKGICIWIFALNTYVFKNDLLYLKHKIQETKSETDLSTTEFELDIRMDI